MKLLHQFDRVMLNPLLDPETRTCRILVVCTFCLSCLALMLLKLVSHNVSWRPDWFWHMAMENLVPSYVSHVETTWVLLQHTLTWTGAPAFVHSPSLVRYLCTCCLTSHWWPCSGAPIVLEVESMLFSDILDSKIIHYHCQLYWSPIVFPQAGH